MHGLALKYGLRLPSHLRKLIHPRRAPESPVGYPEENSSFRFRSKAKKILVSSSSEEWSSPLHSPVARPEKETVPSEARAAYSLFCTYAATVSAPRVILGHGRKNIKTFPLIPSATELNQAGVKFKKMKERSLFDITFDKGVMSIPILEIKDETESILRNLVAFEQCCNDIPLGSKRSTSLEPKLFTDYITFMDCLINREKDAELLCRHGIIEN